MAEDVKHDLCAMNYGLMIARIAVECIVSLYQIDVCARKCMNTLHFHTFAKLKRHFKLNRTRRIQRTAEHEEKKFMRCTL